MRSIVILTVLFTTLAALGQTPLVTSIVPDIGPDIGGTEVAIHGTDLSRKVVCVLPCPTLVAFGEVEVEPVEESDTRLLVRTPPHAAGTVDVTVKVAGADDVVVPDGFTFTLTTESAYEKVLIPIHLDEVVPGANGSQWRSDFWIRNGGTESVTLAPWPCVGAGPCPPVFPLTYPLGSGLSLHNLPPFSLVLDPDPNPSRILYVSEPGSQDVSFSLRVADISRGDDNAGTEIPVIRDEDALTTAAQLFSVPLDPRYRVLLRVYELAHVEARFRINLYAQTEENGPATYSALVTATTAQTGEFRADAAYAQFDISDLLRLERTWPAAVRVEVVPQTPASRYWAFASITNNSTQLVTIVTPQ
jgi:hypothetical protein